MDASVIVIGAGPAGLAVAGSLRVRGIEALVLERERSVGSSWRKHYDRLHLHTTRSRSALPHLPLPAHLPRYPARDDVVAYLEEYARHFRIAPRFGEEVLAVRQRVGAWEVVAETRQYRANAVVVANGINAVPVRPNWPDEDRFEGPILHAAEYRNGASYRGKRVLVVGLGNTGGEIAIDLREHGANPTLSVRSPLVVMPRDVLGLPLTGLGGLGRVLPPGVADGIFRGFLRLVVGDLSRYGLPAPSYGPLVQIRDRGRIPLIDVGTVDLIRRGEVLVRPAIDRFGPATVFFTDGSRDPFDAVILATGYRPTWPTLLEVPEAGTASPPELEARYPGLYFCGMVVGSGGMLRQIHDQAERIAAAIAREATTAATRFRT